MPASFENSKISSMFHNHSKKPSKVLQDQADRSDCSFRLDASDIVRLNLLINTFSIIPFQSNQFNLLSQNKSLSLEDRLMSIIPRKEKKI